MPVKNVQALIDNRVEAIRAYHAQAGIQRAELDVSGGIDSAVMLGLLVKALGPTNITAAFIDIQSSEDAFNRAKEVTKLYGVRLIYVDATDLFGDLDNILMDALGAASYDLEAIIERGEADKTISGSIRSTLRAPIGRALNRLTGGGIRHGTGNEDEDRYLRFYQKGGDGEVDTNPIAMLSKGEVFQLAIGLDVPLSIITARPSPDLWAIGEAHNDEEEIASTLGLKDPTCTMYSYVDPQTSKYTHVGLIERLARWLDVNDNVLFSCDDATAATLPKKAKDTKLFKGVNGGVVERLFDSARRIEKNTRHKLNPNCPSLGSRKELVTAGILTNELEV